MNAMSATKELVGEAGARLFQLEAGLGPNTDGALPLHE